MVYLLKKRFRYDFYVNKYTVRTCDTFSVKKTFNFEIYRLPPVALIRLFGLQTPKLQTGHTKA